MSNLKILQISDPIFWGFNRQVDINNVNSNRELLDIFLNIHEAFLFENNYIDLLEFFKSKKTDYHIHGKPFEELKEYNDIIYVCRHPHENEREQVLK
jgi:hypothetical protein|tara:strand:+ start:335 stop:625 length:291 start_codon:yes stop_codon:yes gene_type:complete